jgi:hypothetical protein
MKTKMPKNREGEIAETETIETLANLEKEADIEEAVDVAGVDITETITTTGKRVIAGHIAIIIMMAAIKDKEATLEETDRRVVITEILGETERKEAILLTIEITREDGAIAEIDLTITTKISKEGLFNRKRYKPSRR